ncbi:MAG: hypothetical protein MZV65_37840 [Chromatiales bacterium]|nr:hypothetical protein [Chromatiales bacterium]
MLHGGGNTSVKLRETEPRSARTKTLLYVKGSGCGPGDASRRPASRRCASTTCCALAKLPALSDPEMVNELRTHMTRAMRADAVGRGDPARDPAVQVRRPHPRRRGARRHQQPRTARRASARSTATAWW